MSGEAESHDFASVKGDMARGALWMVFMRWSLRLVGLVNTLIIARLLTPTDFGISTMAWIIVEFLMMLSETNVDIGVLRNNAFTRDYLDSAWTVKIIAGVATFLVLLAVSPLAADYYHDDRVPLVIRIVALRALIMGFENIGVAEFRHRLEFAKEYRYWVWRRLVMLGFGLGLAFALRNYLALAIAAPVSGVITVILSFVMSSYRPRLSLVKWRELSSFSLWQIVYGTARYVNDRVDQFVIGGIGKAADIGAYYVASDIATLPTREVVWPMNRAFTPTLAKIVSRPAEMRQAWVSTLGFVAIISLSAGVGMSVIADDAVMVLLGHQWTQSSDFFRWLALYGLFEGFFLAMDPFFIARKHERGFALANVAQLLLLVPLLFSAGYLRGIEIIALVRTAVMAVTVVAMFLVMVRLGWVSLREIVGAIWRPAVAAVLMGVVVRALHPSAAPSPLLSMAWDILVGAATFSGLLLLFWRWSGCPPGAEATLYAAARRYFRGLAT